MRTRSADSSKAATPKKTLPARKSASTTPTAKTRQVKRKVASSTPITSSASQPDQLSEEVKSFCDAAQVTPDTKTSTTTKSAMRRIPGRPGTSAKAVSTPKQGEQVEEVADEIPKGDSIEVQEKIEVVNMDDIESEKLEE